MKKLAFSLAILGFFIGGTAFAHDSKTTSSVPTVENIACARPAIEKRESAVISAHDVFSASVRTALVARKDAILKAWSIENRSDRKKAQYEAWKAFRSSVLEGRKIHREAVRKSWETFNSEAKACGIKNYGGEFKEMDKIRF